ncbi:AraC family transcriptional regulator [Roseobacter sp. YSTF-M11]|uniref:AraC family transcriptional regulator n=1 Tax=Roseobacter insulae TaxID=2859783 RepID=A0A9X1FUP0_9RHOB|nr:AraC family transcriptional regulator [Roseobacter insulae]MBW4707440.1 AraC family transcriptional regulator [Roseobacter insulae]
MLDILSDILTRLSVKGTLYFRTSFTEPWGIKVPAFENVARFHFVHRGDCQVRLSDTGEVANMTQGDLVIIPHGVAHALFCRETAPDEALPLDDVLEVSGYDGNGVLVHGGDGGNRETQLICGHFSFAPGAWHMIFDRLPPFIHIPNYGEAAGAWMDATLRVIGSEAGGARLGGDLIALKMSEAIFAQAIRAHIEQSRDAHSLSGFADPHLSRALRAFHKDPSKTWTVESLAREAGMSRTGFAQSFASKIGQTPMQYLTSWRMQIAREGLTKRGLNVSDVAEMAGYASESSFSRVFKKEVGVSPAAYRALN